MITINNYRWPDLSPVQRQYVVRDDHGRYGIAHQGADHDTIWAHPIEMTAEMSAPDNSGIPANAILMTSTSWQRQPDGTYTGRWSDNNVPTYPATVPSEMIRRLEIVDDLGYRMPDHWADIALAGSDQMSYWDYGATLGKVGGEPPIPGQAGNEMTVEQAMDYAHEVGESVTERGIRLASRNGYITGARKVGRDWLIPYNGYNHYLDNRPKRGPKPK
jgi:hypothetical protein